MFNRKMSLYLTALLILSIALLLVGCTSSTEVTDDTNGSNDETQATTEIDANVVRVRVIEFPPFYYKSDDKWTGLEVELANALIFEAGYTPEYVALPWSRALEALEVGDSDLMMNLVKSPEREEYMHFIGPIRTSRMALVVHEDYKDEFIETIDDLFSASEALAIPIGLQRDVKYPIELATKLEDEAYAEYMDFAYATKEYPTNVINNRIFGFVEDEIAMNYQLSNNPDYTGLVVHSFLFSEDDVYAGVSKHLDEEKYNRLVKAFDTLKNNGVFGKIIDRYQ